MSKKKKMESKSIQKTNKSKFEKKTIIILAASAFVVLAGVIYFLTSKKVEPDMEYIFKKEGELTFLKNNGETIKKIDIEVADTDYDRMLGLMFRKSMKEEQGMLFVFSFEEQQSFWMRDTYISLDMIFVNANRQIVTIHKRTKTLSDQSYPSSAPARYVIEVVGGFCDKFGVAEGDKVVW